MTDLGKLLAKQQAKTDDSSKPTASGGLAFLAGTKGDAKVDDSKETPAAKPSGLGFLAGKAAPAPAPSPAPAPTPAPSKMDELQALMASEAGQTPTVASRFADEVPADAPIRELDPDLDEQAKGFINSLDSVYGIMHEPDLLGGVVRNIMIELGNHPEYRKLIQPKDVHTLVRGMRESMGLARIKKEESKAKRSGGRGKKTEIQDLDVLKALDGMDFS